MDIHHETQAFTNRSRRLCRAHIIFGHSGSPVEIRNRSTVDDECCRIVGSFSLVFLFLPTIPYTGRDSKRQEREAIIRKEKESRPLSWALVSSPNVSWAPVPTTSISSGALVRSLVKTHERTVYNRQTGTIEASVDLRVGRLSVYSRIKVSC